MFLYFDICKFYVLEQLAYPSELIFSVAKRLFKLFFVLYFWHIVLGNNASPDEFLRLIGYFLIADGVGRFTMINSRNVGRTIRHYMRLGRFSNILRLPIGAIRYFHAVAIGRNFVQYLSAVLFTTLGITILSGSGINLLGFVAFLIVAIGYGVALNTMSASLGFISARASGLSISIFKTITLLSGELVPLFYYPKIVQKVLTFSPFPWMIYGPYKGLTDFHMKEYTVAMVWMIVLNIVFYKLWARGLKRYEAVGI